MSKYALDATGESLGRIASKAATLLRGKNVASYTPNELPTNEVVINNLNKAKFTGHKLDKKKYYHYSGYHSGIKARTLGQLWETNPIEVMKKMVYDMLPVNRTRDKIIKNLKFN